MFIDPTTWTLDIESAIGRAELVSFDVFDTLLRRPFLRPTDLFAYIEERHGLKDFADRRVAAERIARRTHPAQRDVTYEQIYEHLDFDPAIELRTEAALLSPREDILDLHRAARGAGKRIAVLSDMYLPKAFIAETLERHGIAFDLLLVSGDDGCAKHDGSMFERLLRDAQIPAGAILHVGDNRSSDYKKPRLLGMRAIHVSNEWPTAKRAAFGAAATQALASASWRGSRAAALVRDFSHNQARATDDLWTSMGAYLSAPLAIAFAQWVSAQIDRDGVLRAAFLARDGYLPKAAFDRVRPDVPVSYLHLNRCTVGRALFDQPNRTLLSQLRSQLPASPRELLAQYGFDVAAIAASLGADAGDELDRPARHRDELAPRLAALHARSAAFREETAHAKALLASHLDGAGAFQDPDRFAMFDIGWTGSVADMLASLFPEARRWRFYYFGTNAKLRNLELRSRSMLFHYGLPEENHRLVFECVEAVEALLTSAEPSAIRLDAAAQTCLRPESMAKVAASATQRAKLVAGALAFIDYAFTHAHGLAPDFNDRRLVRALIEEIVHTRDEALRDAVRTVPHQVQAGDSSWRTIDAEPAAYFATLARWLRGRQMRRFGSVEQRTNEELAYIASLSWPRRLLARPAFRIAQRKRAARPIVAP